MGLRTSIFDGVVIHSRLIPKKHNFKYKVFSILFNIDDLKNISNKNLFFSYNKFMKNFSTVVSLIIFLDFFILRINIISFLNKFFNPQNTESIIYYNFFNLFRIDERILFLLIIIFFKDCSNLSPLILLKYEFEVSDHKI